MQRTAGVTSAGITAVTVPVSLGLVVLGTTVLGWFGEEFTGGALALQVLLVGQVVNALCGSVGTVLLMIGRERELGIVSAASAVLNVVLNLVLIPRLGIVGAALASSASLVLFNVVLVVRVRFSLGLDTTVFGLWRRNEETT
jgi:O-antigen/teichoic acid export membrane protein